MAASRIHSCGALTKSKRGALLTRSSDCGNAAFTELQPARSSRVGRAQPARAARRDGTIDAATTDASGAYTDTYTYTTPGTYTINATFQGSPTTLAAGSPGAGGISGDYLLPCAPARAAAPPPRPAAMAGALARPRPADREPTGWACIIRPHQARRACLCPDVSLSELSPGADFRSPRLACS